MKHMKKEAFIQKLNINERQQEQFEIYQQLLCSWNQKMNLTAITDEEEIWEKHFYDSVMPFVDLPAGTLCDVGSGAGFPGIPQRSSIRSCRSRCLSRTINDAVSWKKSKHNAVYRLKSSVPGQKILSKSGGRASIMCQRGPLPG